MPAQLAPSNGVAWAVNIRLFRLGTWGDIEASMQREPNLFDTSDTEAEAVADARADADVAKGRVISHEAVRRWLLSLGTDTPLPRPTISE